MEGLTITCVFPEEASGYDYKSYCENLIEKVKIIQTCEERKWNLDLMIYEKPPITIKTGYVSTVVLGEEERIVFLLDSNNERCPIITDTKEVKQCILGDENFPSIVEKTPFSKRAFHLTIKGYEIDYDDYTIRIGYVNSQGIPYRNILQVVYRPVVYKKDSINKIEWFAEMLALFFDNNQIEIMKKQNSEPAEVEPFGLGKYLTQKYIYLQTYIRVRDYFIKETKL